MPDQRLEKTRATLPEGYQYGDAAKDFSAQIVLPPYESSRCNTFWPTPRWLVEEFIRVTANR